MIIAILGMLIILIALSYLGYFFNTDSIGGFLCVICIMLFSILFGIVIQQEKNNKKPQAIDVYRGNTTLKITYQDSIAVDSVVVFKNK